jgi:hypothetical protein
VGVNPKCAQNFEESKKRSFAPFAEHAAIVFCMTFGHSSRQTGVL